MKEQSYSRFELWLLSQSGKRTLNRLYSWGAALVILGALFKFLEWPYANLILFVSLSMEIIVFIVSGFEPQVEDTTIESTRSTNDGSLHNRSHLPQSLEAYEQEMQHLAQSVSELQAEHQRMLHNLAELNKVYKRMLDAMTEKQGVSAKDSE